MSKIILTRKKVALVHDFLLTPGGAERVLYTFSEMFPDAPIYTLLYDKEKMQGMFSGKDVRTSFLQQFPAWWKKRHRWLLPFYATAIETLDLREYDLIISSSGAWSKGIVTKLKTQHVAYIHSPMRYVWDHNETYWKNIGKKPGIFARSFLHYLRVWDRLAADRPEYLIANSCYTQDRIQKYYRMESEVIYPPVDIHPFSTDGKSLEKLPKQKKRYFLVVSRLTENKRVDLVVDTFEKLNLPLKVVGSGSYEHELRKHAGENIEFLGWKNDVELSALYRGARAVVVPSEEDFGIVCAESLRHGIPVIAYGEGGAREMVVSGMTGELFRSQEVGVLADAVRRFLENEHAYDRSAMRATAKCFSSDTFVRSFREFLEQHSLV